ncbi:MAG: hypothetical protein IJ756_10060 [Paludibacteraceae bacterium]|nr:hypothetical protein [Paludibacteraceae bacterium]
MWQPPEKKRIQQLRNVLCLLGFLKDTVAVPKPLVSILIGSQHLPCKSLHIHSQQRVHRPRLKVHHHTLKPAADSLQAKRRLISTEQYQPVASLAAYLYHGIAHKYQTAVIRQQRLHMLAIDKTRVVLWRLHRISRTLRTHEHIAINISPQSLRRLYDLTVHIDKIKFKCKDTIIFLFLKADYGQKSKIS